MTEFEEGFDEGYWCGVDDGFKNGVMWGIVGSILCFGITVWVMAS
jgi:hypothetical protein